MIRIETYLPYHSIYEVIVDGEVTEVPDVITFRPAEGAGMRHGEIVGLGEVDDDDDQMEIILHPEGSGWTGTWREIGCEAQGIVWFAVHAEIPDAFSGEWEADGESGIWTLTPGILGISEPS